MNDAVGRPALSMKGREVHPAVGAPHVSDGKEDDTHDTAA